jgi:4-hydroxy-3-polyprenylbenzoate decarboxylase
MKQAARHERSRPLPREYPDLHDHVAALDQRGLLIRISEPIDKDSEMHPLVRWQFCGGIAESERKAFLFDNVVDAKGRRYSIPVVVGALAASRQIYGLGMGCPVDEIGATWERALGTPIAPRVVDRAPCHELVFSGPELDVDGRGLDGLPIPISTPGWDNAPYTTTSHFITADPDSGTQNMGNYRGQIKTRRRLGMNPSRELRPGIYVHWEKYRARGEKMPCAVVLGAPPAVTFTAVQKVPEGVDEMAVAGGLVGAPINVVRAKTVDLLVPAEAEIVIEGHIDTEYLEKEGPFGESHGHVNLQEYNAFMDVSAITRRRDAILTSIISQVTPSESSLIKLVALEPLLLSHLRDQLGIKAVVRVSLHEPLTNVRKLVVIQVRRETPETEVWRALYGAASFQRPVGKFVIAVDEDIDPLNSDAILWALAYRMHPLLDMQVLPHKDPGHGPRSQRGGGQDAAVLMNATLKGNFPPISLPKREFMEHARELWERLGLPPLRPAAPWYGYSLGDWAEEFESQAELAVRGDYWQTGELIARQRRSDVEMNSEVRE